MTPRTLVTSAACVVALIAGAPGASAQQILELPTRQPVQIEREGVEPVDIDDIPDQTTAPDELASLIARLSSDDFQAREAATNRLCVAALTPEQLLHAVPDVASLAPEARARLHTILAARMERTPRAGLGAGFALVPSGSGVALDRVMQTFPARDFLQSGDIILEADGLSLAVDNGQQLLRGAILSRDPGDTLPVTILREGRRAQLRVPLGSYADLQNGAGINSEVLDIALELRLRRLGITLKPEQPAIAVQGVAWPAQQVRARTPGAVALVSGGDSSGSNDLDRMRRRALIAAGGQIGNAQLIVQRQQQEAASPRRQLQTMIEQSRNEAEKLRLLLKENFALSPEQRAEVEKRIAQAEARADAFVNRLRTLEDGQP